MELLRNGDYYELKGININKDQERNPFKHKPCIYKNYLSKSKLKVLIEISRISRLEILFRSYI